MEWLTDPTTWAALLTLTTLEIVLGIDNIIFLSVLTAKLPKEQQARARRIGLGLALGMRVALLLTITWVIGLTASLLTIAGMDLSGRDLILLGGGLFLLAKATTEIHESLEGTGGDPRVPGGRGRKSAFGAVIVQIVLIDAVFSLDSIITAVGLSNQLAVTITAVVIAIGVMFVAAGPLAAFVERHPTVKMLALSFLLLIGFSLVAEGLGIHVEKAFIYVAIAFSVFVEALNLRIRGSKSPVHLRAGDDAHPAGASIEP